MSWTKRFGRIVLVLLALELLLFFLLGRRVREQLEGPREFLGSIEREIAAG